MTHTPTFDEIFAVMSAASVGDATARVALPDASQLDLDETATRFAIALNLLLDDLALRVAEVEAGNKEKLRVEQKLRQAQKMEAIGRLAGGVAHDFNNLLSVILSYCEFVAEALGPGHAVLPDIQEIKKAGGRAAMLTHQLLAFSRQQVLDPKILDLNQVILDMDKMIRRIIGEDVELRTVTHDGLGKVKADPGHITQVLMNLIVNARDAMPAGGCLTIETDNVELAEEYAQMHPGVTPGPHVLLAVSDTGIGMDAATRERIFEPFFTTKEQGKGTGLGLSTLFGIVKQSGGNIWVYSEPGKGATFKVYLPQTEDAAEPFTARVESVGSVRGSETILLAEDEEQLRVVAKEILAKHGYRVLVARDAEEAFRLTEQHPDVIQLLLTDVVMPKMNGRELARRMMAVRPGIRVLYMSGYTSNVTVHHGMLDAGALLVQKPITPQMLLRKVRAALDADPMPQGPGPVQEPT